MDFLKEIVKFLLRKKNNLVITFNNHNDCFKGLLLLAQGSVVAPFINTLF